MSKYSFDLKLKVVKVYLSEKLGSYKIIAKKQGVINGNQVK